MSKDILRKLKTEEYFYLRDGKVIKSIQDLIIILKDIDEDTFRYHVNPETNDFANWIRFLSEDLEFAEAVENCISKEKMIKVIENKIKSFSRIKTAVKKAKEKAPVKKEIIIVKEAVKKKKTKKKKKARKTKKAKTPLKKEIIIKKEEIRRFATDYLTAGIREYLLGIITGLILGLIIGSVL